MAQKKTPQLQPLVIYEGDAPQEGPSSKTHLGDAVWQTLLSADSTPSLFMTCGILEVGHRHGGDMITHQHPQSEIYHVLAGKGVVTVEGKDYAVYQGSTMFIPGNCRHGTRNEGDGPLKIFYVFAVDSFQEVEYIIPEQQS